MASTPVEERYQKLCRCRASKKNKNDDERRAHARPAQMPWFAKQETAGGAGASEKFEDSLIYKEIVGYGEPSKQKSSTVSFQALIHSFPHFLPNSFHLMRSNGNTGDIATNMRLASNFVLSSSLNMEMFYDVTKHHILNLRTGQKCSKICSICEGPIVNTLKCYLQYVQEANANAGHCSQNMTITAADFLLEPKIIAQLPFQNGLLLQWMIAALCEYWKISEMMAEFLNLKFSPICRGMVNKILDYGLRLFNAICTCMEVLEGTFNATHRTPFSSIHKQNIKLLFLNENTGILRALPVLQFFTSRRSIEVVEALKTMAWDPSEKRNFSNGDVTWLNSYSPHKKLGIYSTRFWRNNGYHNLYCFGDNPLLDDYFPCEHVRPNHSKVDKNDIVSFVEKNLVKTGILSNMNTRDIREVIDKRNEHGIFSNLALIKTCCWFQEIGNVGLHNADLMSSLLILQSRVEAKDTLMRSCNDVIADKRCTFHPVQRKGNVLTMQEIRESLNAIDKCKEWTFKYLIEKVQGVCSPPSKKFDLPDATLGAEKITQFYENKLRSVVFGTYKRYLMEGISDKEVTVSLELPFLQYILPQIVGLLRTTENPPEESAECKREIDKYVYFLYQLFDLFTAENSTVAKSPLTQISKSPKCDSVPEFIQQKIIFVQDLCNKLFLTNHVETLDIFVNHFNLVNEFTCLHGFQSSSRVLWNIQLYGYLKKIHCALENTCTHFGQQEFQIVHTIPYVAIQLLEILYDKKSKLRTFIDSYAKHALAIFAGSAQTPPLDGQRQGTKSRSRKKQINDNEASKEQILGINLYLAFKMIGSEWVKEKDLFEISDLQSIFEAYKEGDFWKAKQNFAILVNDANRVDLSLANMTVLNSNLALYDPVMEDVVRKKRVKMSTPGEITFSPIMHCRWCGKINCANFRICKECQLQEDYSDVNLFCSEKCEKEALEDIHLEEHARFIIEKLKF